MSRECRKCGEYIPYHLTVNGKTLHLQNRKFCLKCSSYKKHNTSSNDPIIRQPRLWKDFSNVKKRDVQITNYYRALIIRQKMYDKKGGKCQFCGFSDCARALSFHHIKPEEKSFSLSLNILWSKPYELIEKECDKCLLLCLNCHAKLEDKIAREKGRTTVDAVNQKYGTDF